jgi:hypothetical protein
MGAPVISPSDRAVESAEAAPATASNEPEIRNSETQPKGRGLWGLMGTAAVDVPATAPAVTPDAAESTPNSTDSAIPPSDDKSPKGRGLFALMQRADDEVTPAEIDDLLEGLDQEASPPEAVHDESAAPGEAIELPDNADDFDIDPLELPPQPPARLLPPMNAVDLEDLEPVRTEPRDLKANRQCWWGLMCGVASVAGSALAILPQFWVGFPATILGFAAIIAGYVALTGSSRQRIPARPRIASLVGMLLGTAGIFLGPLVFSTLGRSMRESTGVLATTRHLTQMGGAIDRYYGDNDAYPIGGTFDRDESGAIKGQHGWMTALLPFVGETELYHRIDLSRPFDDPVNRNAMGRDVIAYFAAGGDRSRIGQGFAVAHFAGLGGELDTEQGLAHVGIFERDVAVKRDEITDGLANTLIVGELSGGYPPWGDPENWRKIGRGLNKDPNGFGSAAGYGATFLFADGSVKFFSNKTDPKALQRLSTRDGGE